MATTMTQVLDAPSSWSDWNGKSGSDPLVTNAFQTATAHIQTVGLSFGSNCFFETGVTTSDGSGTFNLSGFSAS